MTGGDNFAKLSRASEDSAAQSFNLAAERNLLIFGLMQNAFKHYFISDNLNIETCIHNCVLADEAIIGRDIAKLDLTHLGTK